jgi:TPR repeat protein
LVAATFSLAVGYFSEPVLRPWIDQKLEARSLARQQTVLAASRALPESSAPNMPSADLANLQQLRQLAAHEDAAAENALGLLYIAGDARQGIKSDESAAVQWFIKAANHGSIPAQSKLGSLYWGGRGVTKDDSLAYFWTVLARANGDDASKVLAPFIAARLTPPQRTAIEQKAEQWLETRESAKNSPH